MTLRYCWCFVVWYSALGSIASTYCIMMITVKYFLMAPGQRDDEKCPLVYGFHITVHPVFPHLTEHNKTIIIIIITRWAGQSPTWGRPSPQVRVESQCSYSKFLSQQWQLSNNCKNCIAFYRRTTWHMDLRQLTVYENFRWVDMRAITFLFVGQSSSRVWL